MRLTHILTNLLHKRQEDKRGNRVTNECRNNQHNRSKHKRHAIQTHSLDPRRDERGKRVQKTRTVDSFAKRQSTRSENNDGP